MSPIKEFGGVAKNLAYNPLGIIALFIVLCYAIACLLFGASVKDLQPEERWPLIIFVVVFPFVVLGVFAWLVVNHHTKLYAPKDFPDSKTFLRTLGIKEQKEKIDKEVAEIVAQTPASSKPKNPSKVRKNVLLTEDLVMRELQSEFQVTIIRQVGGFNNTFFDGVFEKNGLLHIVEVKILSQVSNLGDSLTAVDKIMDNAIRSGLPIAVIVLALVLPDEDTRLKVEVSPKVLEYKFKYADKFELRTYLSSELQEKYGIDIDDSTEA